MEKFTPDRLAVEKERTITTGKLLEEGAELVAERDGYRVEITEDQYVELHGIMLDELHKKEIEEWANTEASRTHKTAQLIEGGAHFEATKHGPELRVTDEQITEIRSKEAPRTIAEIREANKGKSIEEVIALTPELAERFEAIPFKTDGERAILLRKKDDPQTAFVVWSSYRSSTQGKVELMIKTEKGEKQRATDTFSVICACCPSGEYGIDAPYEFKFRNKTEAEQNSSDKRDRYYKEYEEARKVWESSGEFARHNEWKEVKKKEFVESLSRACVEQGITSVVMRKPKGNIDSPNVQFLEVTHVRMEPRFSDLDDFETNEEYIFLH